MRTHAACVHHGGAVSSRKPELGSLSVPSLHPVDEAVCVTFKATLLINKNCRLGNQTRSMSDPRVPKIRLCEQLN